MSDQIHAVYDQEVGGGCNNVSTHIVVVEQKVLGSIVWVALAPILKNLGQTSCPLWPDSEERHVTIYFATLFNHLNCTNGFLPEKVHRANFCYVLQSC